MPENRELQELFSKETGINIRVLRGEPFEDGLFSFRKDPYNFLSANQGIVQSGILKSITTIKIDRANRFSNSLIQLSNAFAFAQHNHLKKIVLPYFWYLPVGKSIIDDIEILNLAEKEVWTPQQEEMAIIGRFFYVSTLKDFYPEFTHFSILDKLKCCFNVNLETDPLPDNELVIHIRSGDVFRGNGANPGYGQPPLAFYEKVITENSYKKIHLVYEDQENPVINNLISYLRRNSISFDVTSSNLVADIEYLLKASHLVAGRGTFLPGITVISNNIKKVYIFESGFNPWGRSSINTVYYKDINGEYRTKVLSNWVNGLEQRRLMLDYPLEYVKN